jgi:hypothetical protein
MGCIKMRRLLFGFVFLLQLGSLPLQANEAAAPAMTSTKPAPLTQIQKDKIQTILLRSIVQVYKSTLAAGDLDKIFLSGLKASDQKEMREFMATLGELPEMSQEDHALVLGSGPQALRVEWPNFFTENYHVTVNGVDWIYNPQKPMKWQIGLLQKKIELAKKHKTQVSVFEKFRNFVFPEASAGPVEDAMLAAKALSASGTAKELELAAKLLAANKEVEFLRNALTASLATRAGAAAAAEVLTPGGAAKSEKFLAKVMTGNKGLFIAGVIGASAGGFVNWIGGGVRGLGCDTALDWDWEPDGNFMKFTCSGIAVKDDPDAPRLDAYKNQISASVAQANVIAMFEKQDKECPKTDGTGRYDALIRRTELKDGKPTESTLPWSEVKAKFEKNGDPSEAIVYSQSKPGDPSSPYDVVIAKFVFNTKTEMTAMLVPNEKPSSIQLFPDKYVELKKRARAMTPAQVQVFKSGGDMIRYLQAVVTQCSIAAVKASTDKGEAPSAPEAKKTVDAAAVVQ